MIPHDMKDYRAPISREPSGITWYSVIAIILIIAILGWMGERDHEAHIAQVEEAAKLQCVD